LINGVCLNNGNLFKSYFAEILVMPVRILFVCLGNICRSPLAEAIFISKIKEKGLSSGFIVQSCGTANYHIGDMPDPRTISNAFKNGIHINHVGRQLSMEDLDSFDLILAMDRSNLNNIKRLGNAESNLHKISLMRSHDPLGRNKDVPDPYYGNENDFQEVFDILDRSITQLIIQLRAPVT
jgi:protein-tyrosine phosphatase